MADQHSLSLPFLDHIKKVAPNSPFLRLPSQKVHSLLTSPTPVVNIGSSMMIDSAHLCSQVLRTDKSGKLKKKYPDVWKRWKLWVEVEDLIFKNSRFHLVLALEKRFGQSVFEDSKIPNFTNIGQVLKALRDAMSIRMNNLLTVDQLIEETARVLTVSPHLLDVLDLLLRYFTQNGLPLCEAHHDIHLIYNKMMAFLRKTYLPAEPMPEGKVLREPSGERSTEAHEAALTQRQLLRGFAIMQEKNCEARKHNKLFHARDASCKGHSIIDESTGRDPLNQLLAEGRAFPLKRTPPFEDAHLLFWHALSLCGESIYSNNNNASPACLVRDPVSGLDVNGDSIARLLATQPLAEAAITGFAAAFPELAYERYINRQWKLWHCMYVCQSASSPCPDQVRAFLEDELAGHEPGTGAYYTSLHSPRLGPLSHSPRLDGLPPSPALASTPAPENLGPAHASPRGGERERSHAGLAGAGAGSERAGFYSEGKRPRPGVSSRGRAASDAEPVMSTGIQGESGTHTTGGSASPGFKRMPRSGFRPNTLSFSPNFGSPGFSTQLGGGASPSPLLLSVKDAKELPPPLSLSGNTSPPRELEKGSITASSPDGSVKLMPIPDVEKSISRAGSDGALQSRCSGNSSDSSRANYVGTSNHPIKPQSPSGSSGGNSVRKNSVNSSEGGKSKPQWRKVEG
jgi:hypothetical protein